MRSSAVINRIRAYVPVMPLASVVIALGSGVPSVASAQDGIVPSDSASFASYPARECFAAVERAYLVATREGIDTIPYVGLTGPTPSIVGTTARNCAAHLSVASTDPSELLLLAKVYAVGRNSDGAMAALDRALSLAKTSTERSSLLQELLDGYLTGMALPVQRTDIEKVIARVDTGPVARATRVQMLSAIGVGYVLLGVDDAICRQAIAAALQAAQGVDLSAAPRALQYLTIAQGAAMAVRDPQDTVLVPPLGLPAPPLAGETVVGSTAAGRYPVPGKVTLIISRDIMNQFGRGKIAAARRLKAKFGDALDIVYAEKTYGTFKLRGPLTYQQEKEMRAEHLVKDLGAQGVVIVEETPMRKRPEPDGRVIRDPIANAKTYGDDIVVVGKDGRYRFIFKMWLPRLEKQLEQVIQRSI